MSIQDERDLAERLGGLLDRIEPTAAPVAATMHRGKGIRLRRRIGAAAGAAAIVAAAAVVPSVLHGPAAHPTPMSRLHYKVTVQPPPKDAPAGTVAQGVTDGKTWRLVMSGSRANLTVQAEGQLSNAGVMTESAAASGDLTDFASEGFLQAHSSYDLMFAQVRSDVAAIAVHLADGEVVDLTPVQWSGARWVGLVLPARAAITRAVAYSGTGSEIAYDVPFGNTGIGVWWAPHQVGPAKATKTIGSGKVEGTKWRVTAEIGPWGYCYVYSRGNSTCSDSNSNVERVPAGKMLAPFSCGSLPDKASDGPYLGIGFAAAAVRTVALKYSDGSTASLPAVWVSGGRVFAYVLFKGVHVTSAREYGAAGQLVGTTSASSDLWKC